MFTLSFPSLVTKKNDTDNEGNRKQHKHLQLKTYELREMIPIDLSMSF